MAERSSRRFLGSSRREVRSAQKGDQIVVIGLGRFGGAVAEELARLGFEVLGIDEDRAQVQYYAEVLTHAVEADATNEEVLRQLGAVDFRHAVVGIGTDIEASVLTTSALVDVGVRNIWAKAISSAHGRILERVGAHHVVFPEDEMGRRVAHMVGGGIIDWFQLDEEFAIVETVVPDDLVGRPLGDLRIPARYGVTVVCIKPPGERFTYATSETVLDRGAVLVIAGPSDRAQDFAQLH